MNLVTDKAGQSYLAPFLLVISLFFLWGFAHSILDVLNKHFQDVLVISKARSGLVQAMVYGGYFLMAVPSGIFINRHGYKCGVILGLVLYGIGALLFVPGASLMSFPFFLLCLFIIGCGLTCLETSANPYVTILGDPGSAARRINLAQSLNGLGWIVGPLVGGLMVLGDGGDIAIPYAGIGGIVLVLALFFTKAKLPEVEERNDSINTQQNTSGRLHRNRIFLFGIAALFLYVAAQTGINSFFINYVIEADKSITPQTAALMLSFGGMGLFLIGRLLGVWVMKGITPATLVMISAAMATLCMAVVVVGFGMTSTAALCLTYLFESIMFPTIFSMALAVVPPNQTKIASSLLIMSIVGGAIAPMAMGWIGETNMAAGFVIPLFCFIGIFCYSLYYMHKVF